MADVMEPNEPDSKADRLIHLAAKAEKNEEPLDAKLSNGVKGDERGVDGKTDPVEMAMDLCTRPNQDVGCNGLGGDEPVAKESTSTPSVTGSLQLSMEKAPQPEVISSPEVDGEWKRHTRTKGNLKKQLRMKRGQKVVNETDPAEAAAPLSPKLSWMLQSPSKTIEQEPGLDGVIPPVPCASTGADALQLDTKWHVGDMLWAKVSGHPWWPCIVGYDPFQSIYTRVIRGAIQFHVLFFGNEGERGWVFDAHIIPFEGKAAFDAFCNGMINVQKKPRKDYTVSPYRINAWNIAVAAAEVAFPMTRDDRVAKLTVFNVVPAVEAVPTVVNGEGVDVAQTAVNPEGVVKKKRQRVSIDGDSSKPPTKRRKKQNCSEMSATESSGTNSVPSSVTVLENESILKSQVSISCAESKNDEKIDLGESLLHLPVKTELLPDGKIARGATEAGVNVGEVQGMSKDVSDTGKDGSASDAKTNANSSVAGSNGELNSENKLPTSVSKSGGRRTKRKNSDAEIENSTTLIGATGHRLKYRARRKLPTLIPDVDSLNTTQSTTDDAVLPTPQPTGKRKSLANGQNLDSDRTGSDTGSSGTEEPHPGKKLEISKLNVSTHPKKEDFCTVCEGSCVNVPFVQCQGPCLSVFHVKCLGSEPETLESFTCDECKAGCHTCFACKKSSSDTVRCSIAHCGRFYHASCLEQWPLGRREKNHLYCPLHSCLTCSLNSDKNQTIMKGRFFRCIRCPTAYHVGDLCIAAGSVYVGGLNIICSKHFELTKSRKRMHHVNVAWCFICSKGGTVLCCDSCPASFHVQCLEISPPEGSWHCEECLKGRKPLYGEIVWSKAGSYRWWPGEICHPRNVPTNIQLMHHQIGEFPVRFFGSNDYLWTHQGRVFQFQEGDKGHRNNQSKAFEATFMKAIVEANEAFRMWKVEKEKKLEGHNGDKKPAQYKHVKSNVPIGNVEVRKPPPLSEIPRCHCRPDMEIPCGPDADCINRLMMYECHPSVCPAGSSCRNQRFQLKEDVDSIPFKTEKRGWGLKTNIAVKKGQFVHEYVGDLIDEAECKKRLKDYHENDITNYYMLTIDKNRIIDAGPKGNNSRFMNHSCQPNCETQKWTINGDIRIGLFALRDIEAGTELTFNYNLDCLGNDKTVCRCGAPVCSGFLGDRPKAAIDSEKRAKKKRRRQKLVMKHEDECFRCGGGGALILCDKWKCTKAYHLRCLRLSQTPRGKWLCPWHHCDHLKCGKNARQLCSLCPNSFCNKHVDDKIFQLTSGSRLVCFEHPDVIAAEASVPLRSHELVKSKRNSNIMPVDPLHGKVESLSSLANNGPISSEKTRLKSLLAEHKVLCSQSVDTDSSLETELMTSKTENAELGSYQAKTKTRLRTPKTDGILERRCKFFSMNVAVNRPALTDLLADDDAVVN